MKVKQENKFTPVTITIETQEDFDKIYAIFNHDKIIGSLDLEYVYRALKDLNTKSLDADTFWERLYKALHG